MFNRKFYNYLIASGLVLLAIFVFKGSPDNARTLSLKEISPYLKALKKYKKRSPAQVSDKVLVRSYGDKQSTQIESLDYNFSNKVQFSDDEIGVLKEYLEKELEEISFKDDKTKFKYVNQFKVRNKNYVRYQQGIVREFQGSEYVVPIRGAQVLAVVVNGRLQEVKSSAIVFDFSYSIFAKEGLFFDFSDREFGKFAGAIKVNPLSKRLLRTYLSDLSQRLKLNVDFEALLNRQSDEQRNILNSAFRNIGRRQLQRIFVELAQAGKLSLAKYGAVWLFQVDRFFELPVQFDIAMTEATSPVLNIKNLREVYHKVAPVKGFESPLYPGGKKVEGTESALRAKTQLEKIVTYINEKFKWNSYKGAESEDTVNVHTQLRSIDFRENAAWIGSVQQILVGEDGETLHSLDNSISILGHEYTHAIIQFSSGLLYQGQSGALNEHFADIIGASIEAGVNGENVFHYTVGEDILREETRVQKMKLLDLILDKSFYSKDQQEAFRLREIGMRHLYAPELSYTTQYEHFDEVQKIYPVDCQPSYDNDNCGVHMSSGVLNRALSLVIGIEGIDVVLPMVFDTVVFRLKESSNFQDYLVELYSECVENYNKGDRCNIILASFARVGVTHPDFPIDLQATGQEAGVVAVEEIPVTNSSITPSVTLCGWVEEIDPQNYRLLDGKYNGLLINRNFSVKTEGDYSGLRDMRCACADGRITQKTNFNSEIQNIFSNVDAIYDRGDACAKDPDLANIPPTEKLRFRSILGRSFLEQSGQFCGWVSVNSNSRNVTIIDNRFDAAILVSDQYLGSLTQGSYFPIYQHECACVRGTLVESINSKGTVFNSFSRVINVEERSYDKCIGLEWK